MWFSLWCHFDKVKVLFPGMVYICKTALIFNFHNELQASFSWSGENTNHSAVLSIYFLKLSLPKFWLTYSVYNEITNLTHSSSMREVGCYSKLFISRFHVLEKFSLHTLNLAFQWSFKIGNNLYKIKMVYYRYLSTAFSCTEVYIRICMRSLLTVQAPAPAPPFWSVGLE